MKKCNFSGSNLSPEIPLILYNYPINRCKQFVLSKVNFNCNSYVPFSVILLLFSLAGS